MTNKLIKWEFKSIIKQVGILWIALPVMSIIFRLYQKIYYTRGWNFTSNLGNVMQSILAFTYGGIFISTIAITFVIVITRFYRGLLRDEGYLMHTLPVKTGQLVFAKGLVAGLCAFISASIAISSIYINVYEGNIVTFFVDVFNGCKVMKYALYILEAVVIVFFSIFSQIFELYLSMTIGHLARKHKVLFSILAYFGIQIIKQTILSTLFIVIPELDFENIFWQTITPQIAIVSVIICLMIFSVIYFILTEKILSKKLNLE